jgi:hypothetical protein
VKDEVSADIEAFFAACSGEAALAPAEGGEAAPQRTLATPGGRTLDLGPVNAALVASVLAETLQLAQDLKADDWLYTE